MVIAQRKRIIEDTDGSGSNVIDLSQQDASDNEENPATKRGPSNAALEKMTDYSEELPYHDIHADC